ncbi:MAG: hypothetical protein M3Q86_14315 [Verrucomicrobiota bacterium]|nr:hypothetical protein [Verrucomicrobiota bacterium]
MKDYDAAQTRERTGSSNLDRPPRSGGYSAGADGNGKAVSLDRMKKIRSLVVLPALAATLLMASVGSARADEVFCSSFPGGVVTVDVNANLVVDRDCTIAAGSLVNGNIEQGDEGADWNITVQLGADINGNIDEYGGGSVNVTVGPENVFDDSIFERGDGHVTVRVQDGGLYNGNIEESGRGNVLIRVQGTGHFNGNSYEKDAGNMRSTGSGSYNGSTQEEGSGTCVNLIEDFDGSPCE